MRSTRSRTATVLGLVPTFVVLSAAAVAHPAAAAKTYPEPGRDDPKCAYSIQVTDPDALVRDSHGTRVHGFKMTIKLESLFSGPAQDWRFWWSPNLRTNLGYYVTASSHQADVFPEEEEFSYYDAAWRGVPLKSHKWITVHLTGIGPVATPSHFGLGNSDYHYPDTGISDCTAAPAS
ncbi:hypothetical protein EV189_0409 [Motilibacter rhizosphaerae]|uniref:Secreted protein n=1 Tax=Motilibacter rhizosphaerae TaxID=598652 RepID=A0A4Q7NVH9_9ACTN|nr:hypothetical protein [Motilibacter rhizosphaerae]RZS91175.1 hypothetical protein EV189_0409 [Motilibacter rhizosphaerae]